MLIVDAASFKSTSNSLAEYLCEKGLTKRVAIEEDDFVDLLTFEEPIEYKIKTRILQVLHYIIVPSCSDLDHLVQIISDLLVFDSSTLEFWIETHLGLRKSLRNLYRTKNVAALGDYFLKNYEKVFCFDDDAKYQNILHQSVNDDFLQCTAMLTGTYILQQSDCIKQRNYQGDTPLHLAAKQLRISHLRLLIRSEQADLLDLNRDNRSILHLLLISLNKRWITQRSKALAEKKMLSRSPPPSELTSLISEILRLLNAVGAGAVASALSMRDRNQLGILDYALGLGNISIFGILTSEVRLQYTCNGYVYEGWAALLRQAILMNSFEFVGSVAKEYIHYSERRVPSADSGDVNSAGVKTSDGQWDPVDFIILAIDQGRLKSLHSLLAIPTFRDCINTPSSLGVVPLEAAVRRFSGLCETSTAADSPTSFHLDVLRTLIRQGADLFKILPQNIPHKTQTLTLTPLFQPSGSVLSPALCSAAQRRGGRGAHILVHPDNIFALAASYGSLHALRLLLLSVPEGKCILSRALKPLGSSSSSSSILAGEDSGFFFGYNRFRSSPLVHAISNGHTQCLQYLLDSSFSELVNYKSKECITRLAEFGPSSPRECTPLSIAVLTGDVPVLEMLLRNNACPSVRLLSPPGRPVKIIYSTHYYHSN
jgi:Ankyrin repeat